MLVGISLKSMFFSFMYSIYIECFLKNSSKSFDVSNSNNILFFFVYVLVILMYDLFELKTSFILSIKLISPPILYLH